jgi:hypothetical protein
MVLFLVYRKLVYHGLFKFLNSYERGVYYADYYISACAHYYQGGSFSRLGI